MQAMPGRIVEERQQSRYAPFATAPLRGCGPQTAGFVARSSHTAPGIARRSRLASGPGGQQQSVQVISSQTLVLLQGCFVDGDAQARAGG